MSRAARRGRGARFDREARRLQGLPRRLRGHSSSSLMTRQTRHLAGAFAAMLFVGASWGANLPVTKVMLLHFDLIPMAALRTVAATVSLALLLWAVEGTWALRIHLRVGRFLGLGFIMAALFLVYALGVYWSNPITAATIQVAGPLVSAVTVRLSAGQRFDPGFGVALALSLLGGAVLASRSPLRPSSIPLRRGAVVLSSDP